MKPHNLVNAEANHFGNHFSQQGEDEDQEETFAKKLTTGMVASILVFSVYAISPYVMNIFEGSNNQAPIITTAPEPSVSPTYVDSFIWTAKLKLEDLKLNHRLKITTNDQSQLLIVGNISSQEVPNWESFLNWYESREGFPDLVHTVGFGAVSGNIPILTSVWFDASPTAYFADGSSGRVGTVLKDGWKIVGIEAWAIFVERDGTTITLGY